MNFLYIDVILTKTMTDYMSLGTLADVTALMEARLHLERSARRQEWQKGDDALRNALRYCMHPEHAGLSSKCTNEAYKAFANSRLDYIGWRAAVDPPGNLVPYLQRLLDKLLAELEYSAVFALLYYPHGTITVKPEVVNVDGRLFLRGREGCQEKTRPDRRDTVVRLVPVVLRIPEATLREVVRLANLKVCVKRLMQCINMADVHQPQHPRAIRHLGAQCLFLALQRDPVLLDASPRGWPAWLNVALGHIVRSNQYMGYLL